MVWTSFTGILELFEENTRDVELTEGLGVDFEEEEPKFEVDISEGSLFAVFEGKLDLYFDDGPDNSREVDLVNDFKVEPNFDTLEVDSSEGSLLVVFEGKLGVNLGFVLWLICEGFSDFWSFFAALIVEINLSFMLWLISEGFPDFWSFTAALIFGFLSNIDVLFLGALIFTFK